MLTRGQANLPQGVHIPPIAGSTRVNPAMLETRRKAMRAAGGLQPYLEKNDPFMRRLMGQRDMAAADLELQSAEEMAQEGKVAAARQNQLALALATRRRAPGGGIVMGQGAGQRVPIGTGGLSRANAEHLLAARKKNLDAKYQATVAPYLHMQRQLQSIHSRT